MIGQFDKAAERGEPSYVWRSGQERRLQMVRSWLPGDGTLLDSGCGLGAYTRAMSEFFDHTVGLEIEEARAAEALAEGTTAIVSSGERLPFDSGTFSTVFSNEVLEHTADDQQYLAESIRVLKSGGRLILFCPNRWHPVEQHGVFWRGKYHFGNIPLVNYLPDFLRNRLAPHVRAYAKRDLWKLIDTLPVEVVFYRRIFGGYDNVARKYPIFGRLLRRILYWLESTPFSVLGLSHLLVVQKD